MGDTESFNVRNSSTDTKTFSMNLATPFPPKNILEVMYKQNHKPNQQQTDIATNKLKRLRDGFSEKNMARSQIMTLKVTQTRLFSKD